MKKLKCALCMVALATLVYSCISVGNAEENNMDIGSVALSMARKTIVDTIQDFCERFDAVIYSKTDQGRRMYSKWKTNDMNDPNSLVKVEFEVRKRALEGLPRDCGFHMYFKNGKIIKYVNHKRNNGVYKYEYTSGQNGFGFINIARDATELLEFVERFDYAVENY